MTREEIHAKVNAEGSISKANVIDFMWEHFQSRICKNCKYLSSCGKQCNNEEVGKMVDQDDLIVHSMIVHKDFGCIPYFERK